MHSQEAFMCFLRTVRVILRRDEEGSKVIRIVARDLRLGKTLTD